MGGYGSGRIGGRPTVESGLTIDLCRLIRQGDIQPGAHVSGILTWRRSRTGETVARIGYEASMLDPVQSWLRLIHIITHSRDGRKVNCDYRVLVESTWPHFGGCRWWFICPLTGRRTANLYLANGADRFAARDVYRVAYASQNNSMLNRSHAHQARLYAKLGQTYVAFQQGPPPRPKWMRRKTYQRLLGELALAEAEHDAIFMVGAKRLLARGAGISN